MAGSLLTFESSALHPQVASLTFQHAVHGSGFPYINFSPVSLNSNWECQANTECRFYEEMTFYQVRALRISPCTPPISSRFHPFGGTNL